MCYLANVKSAGFGSRKAVAIPLDSRKRVHGEHTTRKKISKNVRIMPEGAADVCVVSYSSRGHTGAQRRVVPCPGVACLQSLDQENSGGKKRKPTKTERHTNATLWDNLARQLHTGTAHECSDFCEHQETRVSPSLLGWCVQHKVSKNSDSVHSTKAKDIGSEAEPS